MSSPPDKPAAAIIHFDALLGPRGVTRLGPRVPETQFVRPGACSHSISAGSQIRNWSQPQPEFNLAAGTHRKMAPDGEETSRTGSSESFTLSAASLTQSKAAYFSLSTRYHQPGMNSSCFYSVLGGFSLKAIKSFGAKMNSDDSGFVVDLSHLLVIGLIKDHLILSCEIMRYLVI